MKFISKLTLAAALTAGMATTVMVQPAAAQKKGKADKNAGALKLSDAVRVPVAAAQTALAAKDYATTLSQLAIAEPLATTDDEKYIVAAIKLQATAPANDLVRLSPMLDVLLANPKTPPEQIPQYNYFRGQVALQQKKYAEALPYLQKAQSLGYKNDNINLNIATAMVESGNTAGGLQAIDAAIQAETAAGKKAPEDWYNYAIGRVYGKDPAALADWSQKKLTAYPTAKNWREALLLYREGREKSAQKLDRGQQLDLFRLMRTTKSLADRGDYIEYADISYIGGFPGEAKSVLDEGKATGKIASSDATAAKMMTDINLALRNEGSLAPAEAKAKAAANGKMALATADAYMGLGQTSKAIELYQVALQKGGVDAAEANLHLGMAYAQAGQKDQARTTLQAVSTGPRKDIASYWLKYLDTSVSGATPVAQ